MKQLKYGRKRKTQIYCSKSETQDGLRIVTAPHAGEQCGMSTPLAITFRNIQFKKLINMLFPQKIQFKNLNLA